MSYYFAVFYEAEEGGYVAQFPDLPEAFTQGETLAETIGLAQSVLAETVEEYARVRKPLPTASELEAIKQWAAEHSHDDGAILGLVHINAFTAPSADTTPVRVTISLAKSALEEIDHQARLRGMTRSGYLAHAALHCSE